MNDAMAIDRTGPDGDAGAGAGSPQWPFVRALHPPGRRPLIGGFRIQ